MVLISARSSHITCRAPQPTIAPSPVRSATQNSWMSSYSVTVALPRRRRDATFWFTRPAIARTSRVSRSPDHIVHRAAHLSLAGYHRPNSCT